MQENNRPRLKIKIIVRAWGDEPVELFMQHVDNKRTYVEKENSDRVIGLPAEEVYIV